jgi:Fic family protein
MSGYKPPYTITSKMLDLSTRISEALANLEHSTKEAITPILRKKNRIKTIAGTLEIEGNFLGEEKITAILEGKRVLGTMLEVAEVEGAIAVYKELENYRYNKLDDLLKAHRLMMNGILKSAGEFRRVNVGVGSGEGVSHVAPPYDRVPELMGTLFDWLDKSDEHLLIKSCVFHYEFEFIHPFSDGNGRIGRLWQSVILYAWKPIFSSMPTESIIRDNQEAYYKALEAAGSAGESTPFVEFMLEMILHTILNVPNYDPDNVPKKRSEQILEQLHKTPEISVRKLSELFLVSEKTIKRDLEKLKEQQKIQRIGSNRKGYWQINKIDT